MVEDLTTPSLQRDGLHRKRTLDQQGYSRFPINLEELEPANLIVIGTPMYNYGMPALKAWIDQVIQIDALFI